MLSLRRTPALLVATVFVVVAAVTFGGEAQCDPGRAKVSVPANILRGAAVTKGRAFYSTDLPEDSLAGIRLGRPAKEILAKWGNPSRITVGTSSASELDTGVAGTQAGPPFLPGIPGMSSGGGVPGLPGLGPMPPGGIYGPGGGAGAIGAPGPSMLASVGSEAQTPSASAKLTQEEVTWTYDLQNGITLEFIITDGITTQITAGGVGPWGLSKTRTGLQLGDTYKLVLWVCGYPEAQEYAGRFLRTRYVNRNRALFTFLKNRLVGVTIALVPEDLR